MCQRLHLNEKTLYDESNYINHTFCTELNNIWFNIDSGNRY